MFGFKSDKGIDSIFGVHTQMKGEIKSQGTIRIDGTFEGNLEADWVILGGSAYFKGEINARGLVVGGKIEGQVNAKESVEIKANGQIVGELTTDKLIIAEGGILEGHTTRHRELTTVIEFPQKSEP